MTHLGPMSILAGLAILIGLRGLVLGLEWHAGYVRRAANGFVFLLSIATFAVYGLVVAMVLQ